MRKHIQEKCTNIRCMNATINCIILVMKLKLNTTHQNYKCSLPGSHKSPNSMNPRAVFTATLAETQNFGFY